MDFFRGRLGQGRHFKIHADHLHPRPGEPNDDENLKPPFEIKRKKDLPAFHPRKTDHVPDRWRAIHIHLLFEKIFYMR